MNLNKFLWRRRLTVAGAEHVGKAGDDPFGGIEDGAVKVKDGGGVFFHWSDPLL